MRRKIRMRRKRRTTKKNRTRKGGGGGGGEIGGKYTIKQVFTLLLGRYEGKCVCRGGKGTGE